LAPQLLQNFVPAGATVEQTGHVMLSAVPQWAQKLASLAFC
jgi:hypothetical protein